MSACRVIETVRPETTSRGDLPPTTVQRTGRKESRSAPGGAAATVNNKSRQASLFMRLQIYTSVGAIPAICTLSQVLRSTDCPSFFPRVDATHAVFLRELVQCRPNCDVV